MSIITKEDPTGAYHPVTHVIFDFDGLLVDTETVYTKATNEVAAPHGKIFTMEHKVQVMGVAPRESSQRIIEVLGLPLELDDFMAQMATAIDRHLPNVDLLPGAEKLVKHFKDMKIPMAIATGSTQETFAKKTEKFGDFFTVGNHFAHIVCTGDDIEVKRGKPAPDCFEICARRFEKPPTSPKNVLVFEDAPAGVIGALAANMQVVFVPDQALIHDQEATLILKSLMEFEPMDFHLPPY